MSLKIIARLSNSQGSTVYTDFTNAITGANSSNYFIPYQNSFNSVRIYVDPLVSIDPNADRTCIWASDLVWMHRYLLGLNVHTPAQRIASDVNIDGTVDLIDVLETRKVILGLEDQFNNSLNIGGLVFNNVAGVFPTSQDLSNITSTGFSVPYSSRFFYSPIPSIILLQQNFVAIRLGDVNQSCPSFQ